MEKYLNDLRQTMMSVEKLPDKCWADIESLIKIKEYPKSSFFAKAGDYPTDLGFVCKGSFRAFYRNKEGNEYNKTFFIQNTFILALTALVKNVQNQINLQALEDSILIQINYRKFTSLYDNYPLLERFARKVIEHEWVKKEIREIQIVQLDAAERYKIFRAEYPELENKIPQYHIASYLGITPVQLSRIRANPDRN
jgi:CRP-like cAMP-binding protein